MRVERDWEDGIGQRLHDFEGELSPQAWNNINKRIKPRRSKRYLWLPALLLFLALPATLYFRGALDGLKDTNHKLAQNPASGSENHLETTTKTVGIEASKPAFPENKSEPNAAENGSLSEPETQTAIAASEPAADKAPFTGKAADQKPGNALIPGVVATGSRPAPIAASENEKQRTEDNTTLNNKSTFSTDNQTDKYTTKAIALSTNRKKQALHQAEATALSAPNQAKTVGFQAEKPGNNSAALAANNAQAASGNAESNAHNLSVNEIASLLPKIVLPSNSYIRPDFPETLPDTIKKFLITVKPAPDNLTEKPAKKRKKQPVENWAFAVYGTPQYTFQRVLPNKQDNLSILKLENQNSFEEERIGYEFGMRSYYQVRKNLQLSFGLQISQLNQHLRMQTANVKPDSVVIKQQNNSASMQIYNSPKQETHLFRYFFGGIYTGLQLGLSEKIDLAGGMGMNWLLQSQKPNEQKEIASNAFNPYLNLSLLYKQPLGQKLTFSAGPAMNYFLRPVQQKQAFVGVKPTTIGLTFSLQYKP